MKVRESLMDNSGESGDNITVPDGISRFPNNALWGWLRLISYLYMCFFIGVACFAYNDLY